jgi:hypothetical protein
MAERKPWASLSPAYRERLARKGITPQMHAAGESIRAARGHEHTPEHPKEAQNNPRDFGDYLGKRRGLVQKVAQIKRRLFGDSHKFNPKRSADIINMGWKGENPPSNAKLQWAIEASEDELLEAITSGDEEYSFLWYH